ncbi:MAG TPA: energy-coupling factor transporter transmembrane protein EcfT [Firmicutes bacterium]|nr:energy-coupling factor transporter transmembrane protein EcfT [Bacillota bacterium]
MKSITLGQYIQGETIIHRLDPRFKVVILLLLIAAVFIIKTFAGFGLLFALLGFTLLLSRLPCLYFLRGLRPLLFLGLLTLLLHFFLTKGGEVYLALGPVTVEQRGVFLGLFMALRLVFLVASTNLLTLTTSPVALADSLEALGKPAEKIGFPVHEMAMMMTIALRFIPTLMEESGKIMKAQMARGADFETGNIIKRARSMVPLLVPLFISAFRRADDLAIAMEARCYQGGKNRTRMKEMAAVAADYLALGLVSLILLFIIISGL